MTNAFLLTRQWRDATQGMTLDFWFASQDGAIHVEINNQEAVAFIRTRDTEAAGPILSKYSYRLGDKPFKNHLGENTIPLYSLSYRTMQDIEVNLRRVNIPLWEADIRPPERYMMERFITGGVDITPAFPNKGHRHKKKTYLNAHLSPNDYRPELRCLSIDIETSMSAKQLYSIGAATAEIRHVFMVGGESFFDEVEQLHVTAFKNEQACLLAFFQWVQEYDPDIFIGWSVVQFDFYVLEQLCKKYGMPLNIGRGKTLPHWREDKSNNRVYLTIPGRLALDGIEVLKSATYNFPSFSLESVAQELLGEGKLINSQQRGLEITELYQNDKVALARYNVQDCLLVWDIFKKADLLAFCIERTQMTGLQMDRMGGSVAAFEFAYLPQLHRKGYVAPNLGELISPIKSPGGYVLDSMPGIYKNVLVLDFKSLYPSIIRTFCIDPYAYWYARDQNLLNTEVVNGFNEAFFAKNSHILPGLIEVLWQGRDRAKSVNNLPLSQTIKIIMNSFYGVLGSTGCRFFDPRVCSSITLRGHEILQQSQKWIEEYGHTVIYGDTDSVFVWVGDAHTPESANALGQDLAAKINVQWQLHLQENFAIKSALEVEFETLYTQFLMPTIRNSTAGSKKRYAGIVSNNSHSQLVFKGMENVRTDWTDLAKNFQYTLYSKVFSDKPVTAYIQKLVNDVLDGKYDQDLTYRKRLRRQLQDYQKNVPPHVQAARKYHLETGEQIKKGNWIPYRLTVNGPEYVDHNSTCPSPIDYDLYIQRQLKPIADSLLQFIDLNFDEITSRQMGLF